MTNLNDFSRGQLVEAARIAEIEVDGRWNDNTLAAKLIEAGITAEQIQSVNQFSQAESTSALSMFNSNTAPSDNDRVILKMTRANKSFSILNHKFTQDHPYVVMNGQEAKWIMGIEEGFSIASPEEAAEFYKGK